MGRLDWKALAQLLNFIKKGGLGPSISFNPTNLYCCTCTKPGKWAVMYRCMGNHFVPVPSQGSQQSCIGIWYPFCTCTKPGKSAVMYRCIGIHFVPVPSQGSERSCIGVWVSILYLYQAKEVSGHVYRCMGIHFVPVPSQGSQRSCIGVWVSILYLYQAREVSGHV